MKPALVIVDVQNDFCPGGSLAVPNGDLVVPVLNEYIARFRAAGLPIYASRDWHPRDTTHFQAGGGPWPAHCVQGTTGAAFHRGLKLSTDSIVVSKGADSTEDAYSAFQARSESGDALPDLLAREVVDEVYVGGLATDYCVKATVLDALKRGFRAVFLVDASRGVNVHSGDSEEAIAEMVRAGASVAALERVRLADGSQVSSL